LAISLLMVIYIILCTWTIWSSKMSKNSWKFKKNSSISHFGKNSQFLKVLQISEKMKKLIISHKSWNIFYKKHLQYNKVLLKYHKKGFNTKVWDFEKWLPTMLLDGLTAFVIGWGRTNNTVIQRPDILQVLQVQVRKFISHLISRNT